MKIHLMGLKYATRGRRMFIPREGRTHFNKRPFHFLCTGKMAWSKKLEEDLTTDQGPIL
jgi:hypothetical protein